MSARRRPRIVALDLDPQAEMPLEPAPVARTWMDQTNQRFAYRCLPLVIANQSGWVVRSPIGFSVRWNGGARLADLEVKVPAGPHTARFSSHFGDGILTVSLPYLFRTPRGVNLWVKGPANWIKDGIQALEGIVETDWNESTFTMNWKVTRKNRTIRFAAGEPLCMLVPLPRGFVESFAAVIESPEAQPRLAAAYARWRDGRNAFNSALARHDPEAAERGWQRDYMLGRNSAGRVFPEHQTKLDVPPFRRRPARRVRRPKA